MNGDLQITTKGGSFRWSWTWLVEKLARWGWAGTLALLGGHMGWNHFAQMHQDEQIAKVKQAQSDLNDSQAKIIHNQETIIAMLVKHMEKH